MGQQLGWYLQDARAILSDRLGMFTPQQQLIRWVNQGRKQVAKVTGCLQTVIPGQSPAGTQANVGGAVPGGVIPGADPNSQFFTIVGQEKYPYAFANPFLRTFNEGWDAVIDVGQVAVSWSSAMRPGLDWYAWDDFQSYLRSYQNLLSSYPAIWSTLGDGENGSVWLYPSPSVATEMEWLVYCSPKPIYTDSDYDAMPDPFTEAVKYYAAYLAYLSSQRSGQAQEMQQLFYAHLGIDRAAVDRGKTPSYYTTAI